MRFGVQNVTRRLLLTLLILTSVMIPIDKATAQSASEMEISHSCIAVGQRIPQLTVWGSGWGAWLQTGTLTLEWHWGGEGSTPRPATVTPPSQAVTASSFALVFDATGISPAFSSFSLVATGSSGSRTNVGSENLDIQSTCPTGKTVCTSDQGKPVLGVEVEGYDTTWAHQFFYQFRKAGQVGPVTGSAGSDGIVRGEFRGLSQVAGATVTARVIEPAGSDSPAVNHYVTFAAPICNPPPPTTTTASTTSLPGATTTQPDDTVPDATTTPTTRPFKFPGPPVTVPPTIVLPPATPGATLTATPEIGTAGFVTTVTGTGFPPGAAVDLGWQPGIGHTIATVGGDGTFTAHMLVFPNDRIGPRALVATGAGTTAFDAFLVVESTVQPSGQNVSQINRIRRFNSR